MLTGFEFLGKKRRRSLGLERRLLRRRWGMGLRLKGAMWISSVLRFRRMWRWAWRVVWPSVGLRRISRLGEALESEDLLISACLLFPFLI